MHQTHDLPVRPRTAVPHRGTAELVLVPADGLVISRPVSNMKLVPRDSRELRPKGLGRIEIEALVEIDPNPKSTLVDVKEHPQPRTEEGDHPGVGVGEMHVVVEFSSFA